MQQLLSAFGINWSLLLAQAVNFAIVLVALWYFLYKPVNAMLTKRQEIIAKGVADAAQAGEIFARADSEAGVRVQTADATAEKIVAAAREAATNEKTRLLRDAEERAAIIAKDAEARATESLERARRESESDIARLAVLAAEKVLEK